MNFQKRLNLSKSSVGQLFHLSIEQIFLSFNYFQTSVENHRMGVFYIKVIIFHLSHDNCTIIIMIIFTKNNVERGGPISGVELCTILLNTKYKKCPSSRQLAPLLPGSRLHKTRTKYHQFWRGTPRNNPVYVGPQTQTRTIMMR